MARPRLPTNVLELRGAFNNHPERRAAREKEPQIPASRPEAPAHLSPSAREHWARLIDQLADAGIMTVLDVDALAAYCEAYQRWLDANQKLVQYGSVIKGEDGVPKHSPYLRVANDAFTQMRALLSEFGLSPASRAKIQAAPKPEDENPFAQVERLRRKA